MKGLWKFWEKPMKIRIDYMNFKNEKFTILDEKLKLSKFL